MQVEFRDGSGEVLAINPHIERAGDEFKMKLTAQNCEYLLVVADTQGEKADWRDSGLQEAITKLAGIEKIAYTSPARITDTLSVFCTDQYAYRFDGFAIKLPNRIATYTVIGCSSKDGVMIAHLPGPSVNCSASVALTVGYSLSRMGADAPKKAFGRDIPEHAYYAAVFDDVANYKDGNIVYSFDGREAQYPVTAAMLGGRQIFIDASAGEPRFRALVSGIELKRR